MIQIIVPIAVAIVGPIAMRLLDAFGREQQERRAWEERVGRLEERMCKQEEEMREFKLLILRCLITNKELGVQARLDAYDKYKKAGGNSWVDAYYAKYLMSSED
jgi:hypothetical protein